MCGALEINGFKASFLFKKIQLNFKFLLSFGLEKLIIQKPYLIVIIIAIESQNL